MRVPMRVDYGVRALVDLAQFAGDGPVSAAQIASRQHVPEPYLEQVLASLNREGLVRSRRGPQGGYVLAKGPRKINLMMVMHSLEGYSAPLNCITEPKGCTLSTACAQREVWQSVDEAVDQILSSTTIADLVHHQVGNGPKKAVV